MSANQKEGLLGRWSRLKRQSTEDARKQEPKTDASAPSAATKGDGSGRIVETGQESDAGSAAEALPQLPPLEELTPNSDFRAFMDPRVDDDVRRAALRTLFRDPGFNVTDGLDVYAEDYTRLEKLTPAMVAALRYAQRTLFGEKDGSEVESVKDESEAASATANLAVRDEAVGEKAGETGIVEPLATAKPEHGDTAEPDEQARLPGGQVARTERS